MNQRKLIWAYVALAVFFIYIFFDTLQGDYGHITNVLVNFIGVSGIVFVMIWIVISPALLYFSRRVAPDAEPEEKNAVVTSPLIKINGRRWVEVTEVNLAPSPTTETAQNHCETHEIKCETLRHETVGKKKYGVGDIERVMSLRKQTDTKGKPTPIRVIADITGISSATVGRIVKENS